LTTNKKKALVTGVAGFLGSNVLERLLQSDWSVVGIDNLSMGRVENIGELMNHPQFTFKKADVTERGVFDSVGSDFDCILHLAAFKIPRYGKAIETLKINYHGTENALDVARERQCKCVLASTSDVYGRNPDIPFAEESTDSVIGSSKSPRWAYAVSKLFDEHLGLAYQDAYGFPVTSLRFFGSYGPKQHLSWWAGPQAVFIIAVLDGKPIPIHGDGKQTRSFTYVSDTVRGIYASIVNDSANGEIINIGSTDEITILELAEKIKRLSDTPGELDIEFVPYESFTDKKYQDVMRRVPDTSLCQSLLGVKAEVGLEEGLVTTIQWQRAARETQARAD
jgi:UDP-glucose 4-epimerase